jgi:hypothetical protein
MKLSVSTRKEGSAAATADSMKVQNFVLLAFIEFLSEC